MVEKYRIFKILTTTSMQKIITYTDGGSRGNPGPAAIGVVIKNEKEITVKAYGEALGVATNNEAEYRAVVSALEKVKAMAGKEAAKKMRVEMRMDSQLVMRQLNGEYRMENEKLIPFFIRIHNLKIDFAEVVFKHVPREENREADAEVNRALDEQKNLFGA